MCQHIHRVAIQLLEVHLAQDNDLVEGIASLRDQGKPQGLRRLKERQNVPMMLPVRVGDHGGGHDPISK